LSGGVPLAPHDWPSQLQYLHRHLTNPYQNKFLTRSSSASSAIVPLMEDEAGPIFRASKRRRVVRQRASATDDQESEPGSRTRDSTPAPLQNENISGTDLNLEVPLSTTQIDLTRTRRPKKQGIAFNTQSSRPRDSSDEKSLVLAEARVPELVQQSNERFVKPTGKAVVTDDRHMYVDSFSLPSTRCNVKSL